MLLASFLVACSVPAAANLDEGDANRVVVALEERGVVAQKERDPENEGRWRVTVMRDDAAAAASVLRAESLPPPASPGLLDAVGTGSIVPSRTSEHARLLAGLAGELERTLKSLDGVVGARVHLGVPVVDPLAPSEQKTPVTASVLLRHRGATPPIGTGEIQRLVAGAVPGLDPQQVSVVATPAPALPRPKERELARFGPLTLTRGSVVWLRTLVAVAVLLGLAALALLGLLWSRLRRTRRELAEAREAEVPAGRA